MKFTKIPALVSLGLAGALALTACGSGTPKSAPAFSEIAQKANDNAKKATAVTFSGNAPSTSGMEGKMTMRANFEAPAAFDIKIEGSKDGKSMNLEAISVDGKAYMKGASAFAGSAGGAGDKMAEAVGEKYIEMPAAQASSMDPTKMRDEMVDDMPKGDDVTAAGEVVKFEGKDAYAYTGKDQKKVYISADGTDQYVGMEEPGKDGKEASKVVISDWNKKAEIKAPAADQVMSMDELKQKVMESMSSGN